LPKLELTDLNAKKDNAVMWLVGWYGGGGGGGVLKTFGNS
jgi:hypothetical protein